MWFGAGIESLSVLSWGYYMREFGDVQLVYWK
jgi:hypothetical protein